MASCERCWAHASMASDPYAEYQRLLKERNGECTPEDQAGDLATLCGACGRVAVHQCAGVCMACGAREAKI